jgi:endonuclease/exonuclease/phosphatase family metal-dependent hydrolase
VKRISQGAAGFLILLALTSHAQAAPRTEGEYNLRVLSYNVKGLPGIAGGYRNDDRFEEIGTELQKMRKNGTAPQIVVVQEAFVKKTNDVVKTSGYPYSVKGPKASDPDEHGKSLTKIFNAGLFTMSEYPIKYSAKIAFGKDMCGTWDCFANKGVQLATVDVPDLPFHVPVLNTHLQATKERSEDRIKQMKVILRFMTKWLAPTGPLLFAGDFNTRPEQPSYAFWKENGGMTSVGETCVQSEFSGCEVAPGTDLESLTRVDQHYSRDGVAPDKSDQKKWYSVRFKPVRVEKTFTKLVKGKPLSDHLGYQVDYVIRWHRFH